MTSRPLIIAALGVAAMSCATGAPLVQPGAPGRATRTVAAADATDLSNVAPNEADVRFMQDMIVHHAQAVEMTGLLGTRTTSVDMRRLAGRLEASQTDEIAYMRGWLASRGHDAPSEHAHHMADQAMPGMLTMAEMGALGASNGATFDRLFLQGMIKHHAGALAMVAQLVATPGAAQDTEIYGFISDIDADQRIEIARMQAMLDSSP